MPPSSSSSTDELQALRAELAAMKGELRVVTVERDLLRERLKAYQRQLFASRSEVRGAEQRDLFLNEAEALATGCEPAQETETEQSVEVGAHERKKRGRKPLNPMLPREVVRHELPESERVCHTTATHWSRSAPRSASNSISCRSRFASFSISESNTHALAATLASR